MGSFNKCSGAVVTTLGMAMFAGGQTTPRDWRSDFANANRSIIAGRYQEAGEALARLRTQAETWTADDLRRAVLYHFSATLHQALGEISAAEPLYLQSKAFWENTGLPEGGHYAETLNNLGAIRMDQGRLD